METFLEILKKITEKEVKELSEDEIAFLKARQDYLSDEEKEKFWEILEEKKEKIRSVKEVVKKRGRPRKK